jgi:hypothetical protein
MKRKTLTAALTLLPLFSAHAPLVAQSALEKGFDNPTAEAKPGTWFHVMSGNMTREGITLDLEAMARVGIGHVTMFNVTQGIPLGRVKFNSDEHIELVAHAAAEAKRLGLTFGVHNSDGWTSSGGPWVTPEQSMKRVVWSEAFARGGNISLKLARPPAMRGFYRDIATIAFPSQPDDAAGADLAMQVTGTGTDFNPAVLTDRLYDKATPVAAAAGQASIMIDLGSAKSVAHVDMMVEEGRDLAFEISASDDAQSWRLLATLQSSRSGKSEATITGNWQPSAARYFRVSAPDTFTTKEIALAATRRIPDFYARSSLSDFRGRSTLKPLASEKDSLGDATGLTAIDSAKIIDLTQFMKPDGTLATKLPKGEWTILRFGYTTTGAVNVPASAEGTGLEVDKFSEAAVEAHYNAYMRRVVDAARAIRPDAFERTIIDSYEVGGQNWTEGYEAIFKAATDRDIVRYLPLYTGRMVGSAQESAEFYNSVRRLNSDLMRDNYFGHFTSLAHKDRLKVYIEAYGYGPFNELDAARAADIPMGEFWLGRPQEQVAAMVSAAHIYGKQQIAAEAFTGFPELNWGFHPAMAKTRGDDIWTKGINSFVFHRFAHQANVHVKPGMTMNRWGSHFDRHQPWWDKAGAAWFRYMARGQYLLQQGHAAVDIAYFVGDSAPATCPRQDRQSDWLPTGYKSDCLNADVLLNRSILKDGRLVLPEGNGYSAIILGNSRQLTANTIKRLTAAAQAGVLIFGAKPEPMVAVGADESERAELQAIIDRLWARPEVGSLASVATRLPAKVTPDFLTDGETPLPFIHRRTDEGDVYFTFNPGDQPREVTVSLRSSGLVPELWDAVNGTRRPVPKFDFDGGRTQFTLALNGGESSFIVLRKPGVARSQALAESAPDKLDVAVPESWTIRLAEATGEKTDLPEAPLVDLKDHKDQRARDFAGTATYRNSFTVKAGELQRGQKAVLDLGQVAVAATVRVNGKEIATLWMPPYRIDIAAALKTGSNEIEIEVPTLWTNRLIADAGLPDTSGFVVADRSNKPTTPMVQWYMDNRPPPAGPRKTFTTQPFFKADDPRVPAGLIGPVKLTLEK